MKKIFLSGIITMLLVTTVLAAGATSHIYLYEKDADWNIVEDGAWGKMMYKGDSFVFNGHGLEAGVEYTLIRYTDPWETQVVDCLGSATANKGGNVHIKGAMQDGGDKVWLVLSDDVDCESTPTGMVGWNPSEYLFENNLI